MNWLCPFHPPLLEGQNHRHHCAGVRREIRLLQGILHPGGQIRPVHQVRQEALPHRQRQAQRGWQQQMEVPYQHLPQRLELRLELRLVLWLVLWLVPEQGPYSELKEAMPPAQEWRC